MSVSIRVILASESGRSTVGDHVDDGDADDVDDDATDVISDVSSDVISDVRDGDADGGATRVAGAS